LTAKILAMVIGNFSVHKIRKQLSRSKVKVKIVQISPPLWFTWFTVGPSIYFYQVTSTSDPIFLVFIADGHTDTQTNEQTPSNTCFA